MAKKFNVVVDSLRKNITREYKAKLTKDQRKAFRSQMWSFRHDPESLSAEEKQALEALFEKIPALSRCSRFVSGSRRSLILPTTESRQALVEGTSPWCGPTGSGSRFVFRDIRPLEDEEPQLL